MNAQKLGGILAVVLIVALVAVFGVRQYGNARVAAQELGTVKEAVSEAVAAREEAQKADAQTGKEKAVLAQRVRSAGNATRTRLRGELDAQADSKADLKLRTGCGVTSGVLDGFIAEANRAIDSTR